ncbi:MAG: SUMF1/EgtB/PvdO family nonheme iron enzyme, partial [Bacteroidales bacterium]|nr:SUMF1/EgtB/PvdO family nonheme iron enzyme [Bacteroidales bacterium]
QALWKAVLGGSNPSYSVGDNLPVERVHWDYCQIFIKELNRLLFNQLGGLRFALPTEAQWEFAARGGNKSKGYKYAGSNNIDDVAWYDKNSGKQTHPVALKQPNELGLYDMIGNVFEWCQDWYALYSSNAQTNPQGPGFGLGRVIRGGCSCNSRVSSRVCGSPDSSSINVGLRLCLIP